MEVFAMREVMKFLAEHSIPSPFGGTIVGGIVVHLRDNIEARHVAQELAAHDNHMLHDIGLLRAEVEHAAHASLLSNALDELNDARQSHVHTFETPENGLTATNLRHAIKKADIASV
jgi:uncharacterized protein YjiS (DUF1127 family)